VSYMQVTAKSYMYISVKGYTDRCIRVGIPIVTYGLVCGSLVGGCIRVGIQITSRGLHTGRYTGRQFTGRR
jgi:hypothetical protein